MKLYVMRHAFAGSPSNDPVRERQRPLRPEGRETALRIAQSLADMGEEPHAIFASPFVRATQTADIVGRELGVQVNVIDDVAPMRPLEDEILGLICKDRVKRVLLVGHVDNTTPAMNNLGGDVEWSDLVMGEVRGVKIDRESGEWKLRFSLRPSMLGLVDHEK